MSEWSYLVVSDSLRPHELYVPCQTPPSIGFSWQEYCNGLPFPSAGTSSPPRDRTRVSHIAGRLFTPWATREEQLINSWSLYGYSVLL